MVERIECKPETYRRWIAEIVSVSGAMRYGASRDQAVALALEVACRSMCPSSRELPGWHTVGP